jgi:hypothetical protein
MRLARAILFCYAMAAALVAAAAVGYLVDFAFFCKHKHAADVARARGGDPGIVDNDSFVRARPDDAIALCENLHCPEIPTPGGHVFVRALCHDDLACYCFPAADASNMDEVARRLRFDQPGPTRCTVDKLRPREDDPTGACPHARCLWHLDR